MKASQPHGTYSLGAEKMRFLAGPCQHAHKQRTCGMLGCFLTANLRPGKGHSRMARMKLSITKPKNSGHRAYSSAARAPCVVSYCPFRSWTSLCAHVRGGYIYQPKLKQNQRKRAECRQRC